MEYLNPIHSFKQNNVPKAQNKNSYEEISNLSYHEQKKTRQKRADATHSIKFPVDPIERMKLKTYCKQAKRILEQAGKPPLSQTRFNNALLRFGLKNQQHIDWNLNYKDSGVYMHSNLLESEYQDIGGPHGIAVRKNLSERKVVYLVMLSVIRWLEGGEGTLEKIL
ncbi:hypothetical protein [Cytobacillus gottheilii]|uniref:hypothetical protein n=1 Tax=Cytobacillus gottheilii TaxID=859144 RepID=UPI0024959D4F|nr:hypothetical protein [Cytobacillus gottheilii]